METKMELSNCIERTKGTNCNDKRINWIQVFEKCFVGINAVLQVLFW
jgi:hypothetical protein